MSPPRAGAPNMGAVLRILVVDDDPDQCALVRWFARRHGVPTGAVAHAPCVGTAVERLQREPFDVVLLDHRVPPDDSAALAVPRLRGAGYAGLVTVMSSAQPDARTLAALTGPGVVFVSKFDLLDHLSALLRGSAAARAAGPMPKVRARGAGRARAGPCP